MTKRQKLFIEAYVGKAFFNATKAAKLAGLSEATAYSAGQRMLKDVEVKAEVQRLLSERAMGADEVLQRLGQIARNEAAEFIETNRLSPGIDLKALKEAGLIHLVKGIKHTANGTEIVLMDPQSALDLLAKHHGLAKERHEVEVHNAGAADEVKRALAGLAASIRDGRVPSEPNGSATEGSAV